MKALSTHLFMLRVKRRLREMRELFVEAFAATPNDSPRSSPLQRCSSGELSAVGGMKWKRA